MALSEKKRQSGSSSGIGLFSNCVREREREMSEREKCVMRERER